MTDLLQAVLTETTCGEACWKAREDVCRCSCGGKNHGCSKTVNGIKPDRTAKIDGFRYKLLAVGRRFQDGLSTQARNINYDAPKLVIGLYSRPWHDTDKGAPARIKSATKAQVAKWPELSAYRDVTYKGGWPYLLWVKIGQTKDVQS